MGDLYAKSIERSTRSTFIRHLLNDVKCLELMLERGLIESGVNRIGAEQEFCLISRNWRPEKNADEILEDLRDTHFTNELARFNLELNLDPVKLDAQSFDKIEAQLRDLLKKAELFASHRDTLILLTGILPTITKTELSPEYFTPKPRYWALNEMVKGRRGSEFHLHIKGVDELSMIHDSVLMEACNTSFQLHLQVDPVHFVEEYNWAQAISGPMLGIAANSPLLMGRELWNETRIALFQQSIDTRHITSALKDQMARVSFGENWESGTIADIYKNDIAQHKVLLTREVTTDSLEELAKGRTPKLEALGTYNGTIYRWNRPCYGVNDNLAHVRIENRYIPAGPSIIDQIANFAFWIGLMKGRPSTYGDASSHMDFRDVKANFIKAARTGKQSVLKWNDRLVSVKDLITREFLPMAYSGLQHIGMNKYASNRLLEIIDQRTIKQTGAQWIISNYRKLKKLTRTDDALLALTRSIYENQQKDLPVHEWPEVPAVPNTHEHATQVGHIMSTRLYTVLADDLAEFATQLMVWKNIHHMPVESSNSEVCGILTWTHMKRFREKPEIDKNLLVSDIMKEEVILTHPEMSIPDAITLMKQNEIGCLPVVHNKHLVGIVTIKDISQYDKDPVT